ncbi:MAG: phytanoyl-CoA dioxygenase family protein, partial [Planctomycetota bacterium]
GLHSGGHVSAPIMGFRNPNTAAWNVGQINVLVALTDIGPGDGATMLVPGSHKSGILHPDLLDSPSGSSTYRSDRHAGDALGAIEVHLRAGQAVLFTDSCTHGATARTNPGERRVLIYRYSPHAIASRYQYLPSQELLERLSPERRALVQPVEPRLAPGQVLSGPQPQEVQS